MWVRGGVDGQAQRADTDLQILAIEACRRDRHRTALEAAHHGGEAAHPEVGPVARERHRDRAALKTFQKRACHRIGS